MKYTVWLVGICSLIESLGDIKVTFQEGINIMQIFYIITDLLLKLEKHFGKVFPKNFLKKFPAL